jgi:hypothetical protein
MYRKPLLDEFIIGLEYEVYSEGMSGGSIEDYMGWYSYKFGLGNCFRELCDIHYLLECDMIRVKV